jgi:outer membrane protein assembly factor BamB/predicted MPP superfamily phosphohydrolase
MKKIKLLLLGIFVTSFISAQSPFKFAFISDTHIGNQTAQEDLERTITNINNDSSLAFVVITGDITEFGSDDELQLAKTLFAGLNKPWYIIPGNHDSNWSESGSNSFKKIFGAETFQFIYNNYLFIGTASGPNMRMSPGQVPREQIVWLDSSLSNLKNKDIPIVYLNHYPQDSSLNNWYEVIDRLKTKNVQLILCGHGHSNHMLNFEGIPAVMGRSNLRARNSVGGYNVVTVKNGTAIFEERNPVTNEQKQWTEVKLVKRDFAADTIKYFRPSYSINSLYPHVKVIWQYQDNSDIGSGTAATDQLIVATNTNGSVYALNKKTGKKVWEFRTLGKIYSTPAIAGKHVVIASTDNNIYWINLHTGYLFRRYETQKPIVANPIIKNRTIFIGASDGHFRAIDLESGKLKWDFDSVKNFVVAKPLFYGNKIFFGSWGTELYALDANSGTPAWKWNNGSSNRMFSPAACYPVAAKGKLFIVAPDRYMTAFDAENGNILWRKQDPANRVRESMGLSLDSGLVYAKTMDGFVIGVSTSFNEMEIVWRSETQLGYELAPTAIVENQKAVFIPSDKGIVTAVNRADGKILWKHKVSNSLVTDILPVSKNEVVISTMDGKISLLRF